MRIHILIKKPVYGFYGSFINIRKLKNKKLVFDII